MRTNLTNQAVKSAQPKESPYELWDSQVNGLILRIQPSGIKTYYFQYKRSRRKKIGRSPDITPIFARELAKNI